MGFYIISVKILWSGKSKHPISFYYGDFTVIEAGARIIKSKAKLFVGVR